MGPGACCAKGSAACATNEQSEPSVCIYVSLECAVDCNSIAAAELLTDMNAALAAAAGGADSCAKGSEEWVLAAGAPALEDGGPSKLSQS